ncbi:STAS domain-containing protein [Kitasatospora hibisci]|uniref:STAS domain-containing protein n=1 Tax=Kitasatospora hibisci TaxID=3369522 RepID=UPI003754A13C
MQWDLERTGDIGVLRLSGFLGESTAHRFTGAVDWTGARCAGAVVVDLVALQGWSTEGEAAIVNAAGRLGTDRRLLAVCGHGGRPVPLLATAHGLGVLRLFPDTDTALAILAPR